MAKFYLSYLSESECRNVFEDFQPQQPEYSYMDLDDGDFLKAWSEADIDNEKPNSFVKLPKHQLDLSLKFNPVDEYIL